MNSQKLHAPWYKGKHLYMVVVATLLFYFYNLLNAGSTNSVIPVLCQLKGWNESTVLVGITIAGYVGAFATLLFGYIVLKKGPKLVAVICMIVCGAGFAVWGAASSMILFIIILIIQNGLAYGFQQSSCPVLVSNWFPRTRGIVLGWCTMGVILPDVTWSQFMPGLLFRYGPTTVMLIVGAIYVLFGVLMAVTIHNFPEEEGKFPDNLRNNTEETREMAKKLESYKTPYTMKKCIKTKEVYQIFFGWCLFIMINVCFISRLVPRILSLGYEMPFALRVLLISSFAALFGSWFFGFLDQRIGTKPASLIFAIVDILFLICCIFMPYSEALIWISACGMLACIGAGYNLMISMGIQKFGRFDFIGVNRYINFGNAILTSSSYALNALFMNTPWGFTGLYIGLAILSVVGLIVQIFTNDKLVGATEEEAMAQIDATANA